MLKDPETTRYSNRTTHRTYAPQFKAELVAACQQPGASIAALAIHHGMNANVLHRWLKEHARDGRHQLNGSAQLSVVSATSNAAAFIPVKLPAMLRPPVVSEFKVELRKGALSLVITWPASAAGDFANWTKSILK